MIKAKGNNYEVEQWGRKVKKAEAGQTRKLPQIGFVQRFLIAALALVAIAGRYPIKRNRSNSCDLHY
jgi:hypothetical protein